MGFICEKINTNTYTMVNVKSQPPAISYDSSCTFLEITTEKEISTKSWFFHVIQGTYINEPSS